jgi:hypothetical protein
MAIRWAVASGDWSNTATWNGGTLPAVNDDVFANNFNITVDQDVTVLTLRNQSNTSPAITAGGSFLVTNNRTITLTSTRPLKSGSATSVITFSGGNGTTLVISCTNGLEVQTGDGVSGCTWVALSGIGSVTFTGYCNFNFSLTGSARFINASAAGTINIIGNISNGVANSGSIFHGSLGYNLNIIGDFIQGFALSAISAAGMVVNITGNFTSTSTNSFSGLAGTYNLTGNSTFNSTGSFLNAASTNAITATIIGNATSSALGGRLIFAQSLLSIVYFSGQANNTDGVMCIFCANIYIDSETTQWRFQRTGNTDRILYAAGAALGNPATSNVRNGTTYGPSLELEGTLVVPDPSNVRKGVPTDNTVGTAELTAEDILNEILISNNPVAERLRNVSTLQSTGEQLEALL